MNRLESITKPLKWLMAFLVVSFAVLGMAKWIIGKKMELFKVQ